MTSRDGAGKKTAAAPWLNWIEQPPPKGQVAGSNPAGVATIVCVAFGKECHFLSILL